MTVHHTALHNNTTLRCNENVATTSTLPYFTPPITLHYVPQPQPAMFMFANWMHPFSYLYVQSNVTCQRNDFWIPKIWRSSTSSTARRIPVQKVCVPFTSMGLQHSLQLPNVGAHTSLPRYIFIHVSRTKSTQRVHAKRVTIFHPRSQFILDGGPTAPFKSFRKFISYRCRSSLLIALGPAPKQKESQLRGNYEAFGRLKHFSHIRKQEYVISKNSSVTNAACQPSNRLLFVPVFSSIAACRVEVPRSKDVGSERNGDVHLHWY